MRMRTRIAMLCVATCIHVAAAAAQGRSMTLEEVLTRARQLAPQVVSAQLAVEEARGRLRGAALRFQTNPQVNVGIGHRNGPANRFTDFELGIDQALESGARRSARIAGAQAAIAQSSANADDVTRLALRSSASAYFRAVHANDRIRLLDAAYELASGVYSAADRRFKAGDIAVLDVNVAKASLARVRAEREGAEASKAVALGELRQLLRLEGDVGVDGTLSPPPEANLAAALQTASQRADLRVLAAGIEEAEAEARLGLSFSRPVYGVGARYSREEGDQIVLGGMSISLPVFSKGQEQQAVGTARAARLQAELDAARMRVQVEVRTAFDAYNRRLSALRVLEADAIPGLDENERLTTRSFEVGQLGLPELLLIRREILDTRLQYLDALLEAALARIDLDASAGILR